MKRTIFMTVAFVFLLTISNPSFAFDLNGWWKNDDCDFKIIGFDKLYFYDGKNKCTYKILKSSNDKIEILFEFTPTYSDKGIIKINNADNIAISYPSHDTCTYRRITHDTSISEEKAMEMAGKN